MVKRNYQLELDKIISELGEKTPTLLLHSCCAPCSSYVLEYLSEHFRITLLYYNPNISPKDEYIKRLQEQKRFISEFKAKNPISVIEGDWEHETYLKCILGYENELEGGRRCFECYKLRLEAAAQAAESIGADYFASTLSISPLKNSDKLNEIGETLADKYSLKWLPNDFKKRAGYLRSIELSREYGLYRQDYCGCVYSYNERQSKLNEARSEQ